MISLGSVHFYCGCVQGIVIERVNMKEKQMKKNKIQQCAEH